MRDETRNSWAARRRKAIKRLVEAWEKDGDPKDHDGRDPVANAADVLAVAHLAKTLEWEGGPQTDWDDKTSRTISQVVEIWKEYEQNGGDWEAIEEQLDVALNAFAIAYAAASFEGDNGPLRW